MEIRKYGASAENFCNIRFLIFCLTAAPTCDSFLRRAMAYRRRAGCSPARSMGGWNGLAVPRKEGDMKHRVCLSILVLSFAFLAILAVPVDAQVATSFYQFNGTVRDASGAVVTRAAVALHEVDTN